MKKVEVTKNKKNKWRLKICEHKKVRSCEKPSWKYSIIAKHHAETMKRIKKSYDGTRAKEKKVISELNKEIEKLIFESVMQNCSKTALKIEINRS